MEEEVRIIPRDAVSDAGSVPWDLTAFTRECFAPLGGVELAIPLRGARTSGFLLSCTNVIS